MRYVCGFLFTHDRSRVVLIRKLKPKWQRGLVNGVGGKIEPDESPSAAMTREFNEEAGLSIPHWEPLCSLGGKDFSVDFFYCFGDAWSAKTQECEEIFLVNPLHLPTNVIPNIRWLVPLALDDGVKKPLVAEDVAVLNA